MGKWTKNEKEISLETQYSISLIMSASISQNREELCKWDSVEPIIEVWLTTVFRKTSPNVACEPFLLLTSITEYSTYFIFFPIYLGLLPLE